MPIHEKNLVDKNRLLVKEEAKLDGLDVSGQWSTFIEQRILGDYSTDVLDAVASTPAGKTIVNCWQCGTCTAGCCMHTDFGLREFNPRYFIYLAQKGAEDELKKYAPVIWRCVTCNKCVERCPKGVRVEEVVHSIEGYMRSKGWMGDTPASRWDEAFVKNTLQTGVLDELALTRSYVSREKLAEFNNRFMLRMALKLVRTGRIRTGPLRHRVKGWEKVRDVAKEILEGGGEG